MNIKEKYDKERRDGLYVNYLLREQGVTQVDIAQAMGITKQAVNLTIHGKCNSRKILDHIASLQVPKKYLGAR